MPRLPLIPRHKGSPELRGAYDRVARAWGMKQTPPLAIQIMQCFSVAPEYVEPAGMGYFYAGWAAATPRPLLELVAVLVSRSNDCFYSLTAQSSALQAAGMTSARAEQFAEGHELPHDVNDGERAIATLVHKTVHAPSRLGPSDLYDVTAFYGTTAALDITGYLYSFHFINRIADLVDLRSELPLIQRRWPWLRRMGVRLQGTMMRWTMDLSRREAEVEVDQAIGRLVDIVGPLPAGFHSLHEAPNIAGLIGTICDVASQLNRDMLDHVGSLVRAALPAGEDDVSGFHPRPSDPLAELVFVGTRYAARTTDELVARVRESEQLDDRGLLDLFYAISFHNGLERMRRLLAEPVSMFQAHDSTSAVAVGNTR